MNALKHAAETARRSSAARELRKVAMLCPAGMAAEIARAARQEHRQATASDRALLREVRDRGGVCAPAEMTREELLSRIPRALVGSRRRCVAPDELAQEFADKGRIADAYRDTLFDFLARTHDAARSEPPTLDAQALEREARRLIRHAVDRAVRELVATTRAGRAPAPDAASKALSRARLAAVLTRAKPGTRRR